jgi:hypothetical protein
MRSNGYILRTAVALAITAVFLTPVSAQQITVRDSNALNAAIRKLKPGDELLLAPGTYRPGIWIEKLTGTAAKPIVIRGSDPEKPPLFEGGAQAFHFSECAYVTLRNITVRGCRTNGINIDDGGSFDTPAHHITLENLTIEDIGPTGNRDGLKLSGLDDFVIRNVHIAGWGGSGIDMVGCHDGLIEDCRFEGKKGFSQDHAVQLKGGTRNVTVRTSFFLNAGSRAINLGGSTGLPYFRPQNAIFEAEDILIAGNRFVGSLAPIAYVNAHNGRVTQNTIYLPAKWALRILQETTVARFKPCQKCIFEKNLVVFDRQLSVFVNIGPNTAPKTFTFAGNAWYQKDGRRTPRLPAPEKNGIHQVDPVLKDAGTDKMRVTSKDPRLKGIGADAYHKGETKKAAEKPKPRMVLP